MKDIFLEQIDLIISNPEVINSDDEMELDISFANGIKHCASILKKVYETEKNINNDFRFVNSILEKLNNELYDYKQNLLDDTDGYTLGYYDCLKIQLDYVEQLVNNESFVKEFRITKKNEVYDEWDD